MFDKSVQAAKAESFRQQHYGDTLLILPNIWDAMGARLMVKIGYPSVATASVATALANGFADGEKIPFLRLLEIVQTIASAVHVPVSVDIERGFAQDLPALKDHVRFLLEAGAVGINIEDSKPDGRSLYSIQEQTRKIEAVRETALQYGVPIVINARTDVFLLAKGEGSVREGIERGQAYRSAGADCFYPVTINNHEDIAQIVRELRMPVNVLLMKPLEDLWQLKKIGVARLSLGPGLLNHALTTMKDLAEGLMRYDSTSYFNRDLLTREYRDGLIPNPDLPV